jgi:hypothetical protein
MKRSSLLDIFCNNSWIKKSNYEGIFNLFIFAFIMVLIHTPLVSYAVYGRFFNPKFIYIILGNTPILILKWFILCFYSIM